ncbi:MAG: LysR family transcriptional regulator [Akkermansiaceae bacterium]|nr:LysR family transcriptional regulator [Akkermansiaceae bacterium]
MNPLEDLSLLRAFVSIVECGSISAAARAMNIPQPTLSRRLRILEENCGQVLIRRDTHSMNLTDAGLRLHEDAAAILEMADTTMARLRQDQTELRGHLRIFATIDFGQSTVTRLLTRFLSDHPGVTAELGYTNRPMRMIEEGFDAGVVVGELSDDRVVALPAGRITRYLVAAPELLRSRGMPVKPADLESWPWITLSGGQFGNPRKVSLISPEKPPVTLDVAPLLTSEGVISMREATLKGAGIAVLPDWIAGGELAHGRLVRILPQWNAPELPVHVIYPGDRRISARVRAFLDFAVVYMKTELHALE